MNGFRVVCCASTCLIYWHYPSINILQKTCSTFHAMQVLIIWADLNNIENYYIPTALMDQAERSHRYVIPACSRRCPGGGGEDAIEKRAVRPGVKPSLPRHAKMKISPQNGIFLHTKDPGQLAGLAACWMPTLAWQPFVTSKWKGSHQKPFGAQSAYNKGQILPAHREIGFSFTVSAHSFVTSWTQSVEILELCMNYVGTYFKKFFEFYIWIFY